MRKILLGMVAAAVAVPTAASAQPGYYGGYNGSPYGGYSRSYSPYDTNRDGVISRREARRAQEAQRYGNSYYGNSYSNGYYGQSYGNGYYNQGNGYYGQGYANNGYYNGQTWRGNDGRYYCRRSDGTTGTLVGGAAGALIGSQVAGRGDRTIGAILGGAVGALIGNSVDRGSSRNGYRCN